MVGEPGLECGASLCLRHAADANPGDFDAFVDPVGVGGGVESETHRPGENEHRHDEEGRGVRAGDPSGRALPAGAGRRETMIQIEAGGGGHAVSQADEGDWSGSRIADGARTPPRWRDGRFREW